MFCTRCGSVNADGARFCKGCGSPLDAAGAGVATAAAAPAPVFSQQAPQFRYAGFWRRFVAMIIDGLVFSPLFLIFLAATGMFGVIGGTNRELEGMATAMFGLGI